MITISTIIMLIAAMIIFAHLSIFFFVFLVSEFDFPELFGGPEGFRKVREVNRKNFLPFPSKCDLMVPSNDQITYFERSPPAQKHEENTKHTKTFKNHYVVH